MALRKNIMASLFIVHSTISSSRDEKVCLMRPRFERHSPHPVGRSIFKNVASLYIPVHGVMNLIYYKNYTTLMFPAI